jgi:hypothetical protein
LIQETTNKDVLVEASRKRPSETSPKERFLPQSNPSLIFFFEQYFFVFEMTLFNETNLSLYHKSHSSFKEKDPPILTRFGIERK